MSEIKERVVLIIDDDKRELELLSESLNDAVKDKNLNVTIESYQIYADNRFDDEIDKLMEIIKDHTKSENIKRVVIVIDLNLMGDKIYTSFDKLLSDNKTGIMVKKYIENQLNNLLDSNEQMSKLKYLFISNYLKQDTEMGVTLSKMLSDEKESGVVKPGTSKTQGLLKNLVGDIKECKLQDEKLKRIIQDYYNARTTYYNFIGTILETALE